MTDYATNKDKVQPMDETTLLSKVLDWLWIIVSFGFVMVFRKLFALDNTVAVHETHIALIQQHDKAELIKRREDKQLRNEQRIEMLDKIDTHHRIVLDRLDALILNNRD